MWKTVAGVVLVGVGVACIIVTAGAASPIVAAVGVAVGTGTTIFGVADSAEGAQDIYYGSIGDIDSTAVNDLKDVVFQGNEEAYYLTESVFAFAASAMIPIGQAASAGNLTFIGWCWGGMYYCNCRCRSPEVYDGFNRKPDRRNDSRYGSKYGNCERTEWN